MTKTTVSDELMAAFLERIENPVRRVEARVLVPLLLTATGFARLGSS